MRQDLVDASLRKKVAVESREVGEAGEEQVIQDFQEIEQQDVLAQVTNQSPHLSLNKHKHEPT